MFHSFVDAFRSAGIPVSIREHLVLLEAIERDVIDPTPTPSTISHVRHS